MLSWKHFLSLLIGEIVLQVARKGVLNESHLKRPFCLSEKDWIPILLGTTARLGWVADASASERSLKNSISAAMTKLQIERGSVISFQQIVSIFHCISNASTAEGGMSMPCPEDLVRDAEVHNIQKLKDPCFDYH